MEIITVITDETRIILQQESRVGRFPAPRKITILNRQEVQDLVVILNNWLKNNVDRA